MTPDIDIEGTVKTVGYYIVNRLERNNCHLLHFEIDGENLENIIGDYYGLELDDGIKLHITVEKVL